MARKKAHTAEAPGDAFEADPFDAAIADRQAAQVVQQAAAATAMPTEHATPPAHTHHNGHAAAVKKRQSTPHVKLSVPAGDTVVHLLDKGDNTVGIGIRIAFPEGAKDRPTPEEKEIIRQHIKGEEGERTGFNWDRQANAWIKPIVREGEHPQDIPTTRPVAIRLDAENRVAKLAEALKHHQADPVGYAEQVKAQREQAAQGRGLPD